MADQNKPNQPDSDYDSVSNPGGRRPGESERTEPSKPASQPSQPQPSGQPVEPNTTRNTLGLTEPRKP
jgi:hypothetical protein